MGKASDSRHRGSVVFRDMVGDVPVLATREAHDPLNRHAQEARQIQRGGDYGGRAARDGGVNLRAVGEVLASYGLDPAVELARVLSEKVIVADEKGNPVRDADGQVLMRPRLDLDTFVKVNTELLQYTRPKLKAIEVTVKEPDLTEEQMDKRIAALVERMAKEKV